MSNGSSLAGTSSAPIEPAHRRMALSAGVPLCLALGLAIVLADVLVRLPLHLPGWRGLIMVPLLMAAHRASGYRWGASLAALASAGFAVWLASPMRFGPLGYVLPGIVVDAALVALPASLVVDVAAGALANLASFATALVGGAMLLGRGTGPVAWLSHAGFGAVAGALVWLAIRSRRR